MNFSVRGRVCGRTCLVSRLRKVEAAAVCCPHRYVHLQGGGRRRKVADFETTFTNYQRPCKICGISMSGAHTSAALNIYFLAISPTLEAVTPRLAIAIPVPTQVEGGKGPAGAGAGAGAGAETETMPTSSNAATKPTPMWKL